MNRLPAALGALVLAGALTPLAAPAPARAQVFVGVSVRIAPPPLPIYAQPPLPGPGYLWTPGYWAWNDDEGDYFWVPGTWVLAPRPGLLWTPAWWGWSDGLYVFHTGYWGPHVGFYGGIPYGFGYGGFGYQGGYWNGGSFFYNRTVNRITNVNVTNVYEKQVTVNRTTITNVSYNGGPNGVAARPTPQERSFAAEPHVQPTPMQMQHREQAQATPALFAKANGGHPPIAATPRPNAFQGPGVVRATRAPGAGGPSAASRPGGYAVTPGRPSPSEYGGAPRGEGYAPTYERVSRPPPAPHGGSDAPYGRDGGDPEAGEAFAAPHRPGAEPRPSGYGGPTPRVPTSRAYAAAPHGPPPPHAAPRPQPHAEPHPHAEPKEERR